MVLNQQESISWFWTCIFHQNCRHMFSFFAILRHLKLQNRSWKQIRNYHVTRSFLNTHLKEFPTCLGFNNNNNNNKIPGKNSTDDARKPTPDILISKCLLRWKWNPANLPGGLPSMKLTAKVPKNWWLEGEIPFWDGLIFNTFAVSFREGVFLTVFDMAGEKKQPKSPTPEKKHCQHLGKI